MTIKELKEKLSIYNENMIITDQHNQNFIHIVNRQGNTITLSTEYPQGYCGKCGDYVYKETHKDIDYPYICPTCDENMFEFEITNQKEIEAKYDEFKDWMSGEH